MAKKNDTVSKNEKPSGRTGSLIPWTARATFRVGKMRRQRQKQFQQQMTVLIGIVVVTVIAAAVFVLANWRTAGSIKVVDCATFPQYCVPLAGGSSVDADLEAASARELDADSRGAEGVVRYIASNEVPTIGDPNAPIHFRTVSNFACGSCNQFHSGDLERFIENFVLTGQATFGFVMVTGLQPQYTTLASQAALCAGDQGAFWEMSSELYRLARTRGVQNGFSLSTIRNSAENMGLNDSKLSDCIASGVYTSVLDEHSLFSSDYGVTHTPTVFVSYDSGVTWAAVSSRDYGYLAQLTEMANANAAQ